LSECESFTSLLRTSRRTAFVSVAAAAVTLARKGHALTVATFRKPFWSEEMKKASAVALAFAF